MRQAIHRLHVSTTGQGLIPVTGEVSGWVAGSGIRTGLLTVWCRHTSASLLVQANADPEAAADIEAFFVRLAPEGKGLYRHAEDGPDNMPAHLRAALTQAQVAVPVEDGRPVFGGFQELYLFEHRSGEHRRELVLHLIGEGQASEACAAHRCALPGGAPASASKPLAPPPPFGDAPMVDALPPGSELPLAADGEAGRLARSHGLGTFAAAVRHVRGLPYGRTSGPDHRLVLAEGRGTCGGKHAFLAALARENGLAVELVLVVYEMTGANTPGVGEVLAGHGLVCIPEAHCFLRTDGGVIDATMPEGTSGAAGRRVLHEEAIGPGDVGAHKAAVHRRVLAGWLHRAGHARFGLDEAWAVREACIAALGRQAPAPRYPEPGAAGGPGERP